MSLYELTEDAELDLQLIKAYLMKKGGPPLTADVLGKICIAEVRR